MVCVWLYPHVCAWQQRLQWCEQTCGKAGKKTWVIYLSKYVKPWHFLLLNRCQQLQCSIFLLGLSSSLSLQSPWLCVESDTLGLSWKFLPVAWSSWKMCHQAGWVKVTCGEGTVLWQLKPLHAGCETNKCHENAKYSDAKYSDYTSCGTNLCWGTQIMNLSAIIVDVVIVVNGPSATKALGPDNMFVCRVKVLKIRPQSEK